MSSSLLFTYGSFSKGYVLHNRITDFVTNSWPAQVKGSVYRLKIGFPVFLNQGEDLVKGTLCEIEGPDVLFRILDEFHGFSTINPEKSLYWKADVTAQLDSGEERQAQVYALNPSKLPNTAQLIANGDWQSSLETAPPLLDALTERQRVYVSKLGASSGREIIPIDLELYRELMKLDLIVDKGRRLALSHLGKEVFKYIHTKPN
jgi:gamma-glutamylcyclotransferase (GGCT)/AIG2-like uncharacterized protein YtfP